MNKQAFLFFRGSKGVGPPGAPSLANVEGFEACCIRLFTSSRAMQKYPLANFLATRPKGSMPLIDVNAEE